MYLVTSVDRLNELDLPMLFTDRNAVLQTAQFTDDFTKLDKLIDWSLMTARMWNNTPSEPDRMERRMAECLIHRQVPWAAIEYVVARTRARADEAQATLARFSQSVEVRREPDWYFT